MKKSFLLIVKLDAFLSGKYNQTRKRGDKYLFPLSCLMFKTQRFWNRHYL